ncbi:hypothetical protein EON68_00570, partial [archaeon]
MQMSIEQLYELNGRERVVVVAHSMGALVWLYFQQHVHSPAAAPYAVSPGSGGCDLRACYRPPMCTNGTATAAGSDADPTAAAEEEAWWKQRHDTCGGCECAYASWTDKYVHSLASVAGPFLGAPKAVAAVLSGEMRDSAEMPAAFT